MLIPADVSKAKHATCRALASDEFTRSLDILVFRKQSRRLLCVFSLQAWQDPLKRSGAFDDLEALFASRIVYIDGAMGTSIQRYNLEEEDYRGERYAKHHKELRGNNDLLVVTKPEVGRPSC